MGKDCSRVRKLFMVDGGRGRPRSVIRAYPTASDGFIVYRYKRPISDSPCKNCPKLFQKVSDIPADITTDVPGYENKKIQYREEILKGFVYTYKVVLYTKSGAQSGDSNYINFNF